MLIPRHLPRSLPRSLTSVRPLTTSALLRGNSTATKIPSLASIIHSDESTTEFKTRVSDFRKQLRANKKNAEAQNLASAGSGEAGDHHHHHGGIVKSILYGSEQGQKEEREMEQSYGKVLARGKYVHAIEFHHVKPDKVAEYIELVGQEYPKVAGERENSCHLVGSWKTEIGDCETFVHIWEYQGYAGYHQTHSRLSHSPSWEKFQSQLPKYLNSRRTDLMQEFSFWPTTPPRSLGGIFELRTYTLRPGNLLEWETHWRRGLQARKNVMEGVGAWFCQVGSLNTVHHLWQFADLRERQVGREQSWNERGWSDTVHKTVPLINKMESRILVPLPWSPVS